MVLRSKTPCWFALLILLVGCSSVPKFRTHPDLKNRIKATASVMVLILQSDVYRLTAGGVPEKVDAWCELAHRNLLDASVDLLNAKPALIVKTLPDSMMSGADRINLEDTRTLFHAVSASIIQHTYGNYEHEFYDKVVNFDYSLGNEVQGLAKGAEALLLISCIDINPTAGRQAVQAGFALMSLLTLTPMVLPGEFTAASIALVEAKTGTILWHKFYRSTDTHDLSHPLKTDELVKKLLEDLPM